jgi:hypothetical protein
VATGTYPYGTFDGNGFDTINVGNLNVHVDVPVLNKAGRGIPFQYQLGYDSSTWDPVTVSGTTTWAPAPNYEIKHVNFFVSAVVGIVGGGLVMLLGAGIAVANKSPTPGQHFD